MVSADYDRFMRLPEVLIVTGLGRNTIYRRMREGSFPRQVKLGPNSVAWLESAISAWMTATIERSLADKGLVIESELSFKSAIVNPTN